MNLAVSDVTVLGQALADFYKSGTPLEIDGYSARARTRVWKAERFSWWFTSLTHRFLGMDAFDRRIQLAELEYLAGSRLHNWYSQRIM
jgi:p-hydroxybenzoate 3-monooxygenase